MLCKFIFLLSRTHLVDNVVPISLIPRGEVGQNVAMIPPQGRFGANVHPITAGSVAVATRGGTVVCGVNRMQRDEGPSNISVSDVFHFYLRPSEDQTKIVKFFTPRKLLL